VTIPYVIGVDLGGSVTRVLVADADGQRAGYGTAGGGNPISRGLEATVESLRTAGAVALDGLEPGRVAYAVLGLAGVGTFGTAVDAAISDVWRSVGLDCVRALRPDAEIAFAAGTPSSDGFVLIAGTGAVSGYICGSRMTLSSDGHGWLLGDRGSGFWLGREAVLAALAAGEGYGPATQLRPTVIRALGLDPSKATSAEVARVIYQRPPITLSEFAPLVTDAAGHGDEVARDIMERAAVHLIESLTSVVRRAGSPTGLPVVMAGGVLAAYAPLRSAVQTGIEALGGVPCASESSVVGAVALAIRGLTDAPPRADAMAALRASCAV